MAFEGIRLFWALKGHWGSVRGLRDKIVKVTMQAKRLRAVQYDATSKEDGSLSEWVKYGLRGIPNLHTLVRSSKTLPYTFYSTMDNTGRPSQVWRKKNDQTAKIFEEANTSCSVDVAMTRDEEYITINSNSRTSSEVHVMRSHDLSCDPELVRRREPGVEYYIDHAHNRFYILTNAGEDREYKLMFSDEAFPHTWRSLYAPRDGLVLHDMELYCDHVILFGSRDTVPVVIVIDPAGKNHPYELSDDNFCWIERPTRNIAFDTKYVPVLMSSPVEMPRSILIGDSTTSQSSDSRHKSGCKIRRICAVNKKNDVAIPITLCYDEDKLKKDNSNPLLTHVYGCYGESLPLGYRAEHEQLVSQGWVLAFCHVRGGGELGRRWYHQGQGARKRKAVEDLHCCIEHLHCGLELSRPDLTALTGRSAGGHTAAMFCNMWPELAQAVVLQVPFVDVRGTLECSPEHTNVMDLEEFGVQPQARCDGDVEFWRNICPYTSLTPQDYPSFYITASKLDDIVPFKGVLKYARKLRQCAKTHRSRVGADKDEGLTMQRGSVILRELKKQGHYDNDDVTLQSYESALWIAFLHKALHIPLQCST